MIDVSNEQLAADARLAAKCLADTGSFETGQAIINDCADRILAQAATIEALRAREKAADELAAAVACLSYRPDEGDIQEALSALAAYRATDTGAA
jgi:hypothetical protein